MTQQISEQIKQSKQNIRSDGFAARLAELMQAQGLNQPALEKLSGLGQNRISEWMSGLAMPQPRNLMRLAYTLGVMPGWLKTGEGQRDAPVEFIDAVKGVIYEEQAIAEQRQINADKHHASQAVQNNNKQDAPRIGRIVRVASWAQAGQAVDYEEIADSWQEEVSTDCPDDDAKGVRLRGDSMMPYYREGDVVVIMPSREPRNGCLVVAKLKEEGVCFKVYNEPSRGVIRLTSYNEVYLPMERKRDDFAWICPVFEAKRYVWVL